MGRFVVFFLVVALVTGASQPQSSEGVDAFVAEQFPQEAERVRKVELKTLATRKPISMTRRPISPIVMVKYEWKGLLKNLLRSDKMGCLVDGAKKQCEHLSTFYTILTGDDTRGLFLQYWSFALKKATERWDYGRNNGTRLSSDEALRLLNSNEDFDLQEAENAVVRGMTLTIPEVPGLFAMTAFDGIAFVVSAGFLVVFFASGFWVEQKAFVALLALTATGLAFGCCYWTFRATGYVLFGHSDFVANVPMEAVLVVGRLAQTTSLITIALFLWMIIEAIYESFFPTKKAAPRAVAVAFVCLTLAAVGYGIAMSAHLRFNEFVPDASIAVLPGMAFVFMSVLATAFLAAWRLVARQEGREKMRRNALLFFVAAVVAAAVFLAECIVAVLYLTQSSSKYETAVLVLNCSSHVIVVLAVLGYSGTAVIGAARTAKARTAGYVVAKEEEARDEARIPAAYDNF